ESAFRASRVQVAGEGKVAAQDGQEAIINPGGPQAYGAGGRPPQEPEPPDAQGQPQDERDRAHQHRVVSGHPGQSRRRRQRARDGLTPTFRAGVHQSSKPPAKPKKSRKKVDAANAMARPKRMPSPRRMLEPPSLMATPAPKMTTAMTAAA